MAEAVVKSQDKKQKKDFVFAVGRRREAVARVRLYDSVKSNLIWEKTEVKKGDMLINGIKAEDYFSSKLMRHEYTAPLRVVNALDKFTFTIKVSGL